MRQVTYEVDGSVSPAVVTTIADAVRFCLQVLDTAFPYEEIGRLLAAAADDEDVSDGTVAKLPPDIRARIEERLTTWRDEVTDDTTTGLEDSLHAALYAGYRQALEASMEEFGVDASIPPDLRASLHRWAAQEAASLLEQFGDTAAQGVAEIIADGAAAGQDPVEVLDAIRAYLAGLAAQASEVAQEVAANLAHYGALEAARTLGMTHKTWLTCRDKQVCGVCATNEIQGSIPIARAFLERPPVSPGPSLLPVQSALLGHDEEERSAGCGSGGVNLPTRLTERPARGSPSLRASDFIMTRGGTLYVKRTYVPPKDPGPQAGGVMLR